MVFHLVFLFLSFLRMLSLDFLLLLLVVDFMFTEGSLEASSGDLINKISLVFKRFFLLGEFMTFNLLLVLLLEFEV